MRLISMFLLSSLAFSQIVITENDLWHIGDEFELFAYKGDGISEGPAGTGQAWRYDNLVPDSSLDRVVEIVDPASTPYTSDYPTATHAERFEQDGQASFQYYRVTSSGVALLGVVAEGINVPYDDEAMFFPLPAQFGVESEDAFASTFTVSGVPVQRTGTIETECDATGSLTIAGLTYDSVLRVHTEQKIDDMVAGINSHTETNSYAFFASEDLTFPVMTINTIEAEVAGMSINTKVVFVRDLEGGGAPTETYSRMLPHMTSSTGGFESELIFWNASEGTASLSLTALNGTGSELDTEDITLQPSEIRSVLVSDVFPGESPTHFGIGGSDQVKAVIAYRAASGTAVSAHLLEENELGLEYYAYPGDWDLIFDGMALVNAGSGPARITAELVGPGGGASTVLVDGLAPNGKYLSTFASLFDSAGENVVRIRSDQDLGTVFLKGTYVGQDPSFLYANLPVRPSASVSMERWLAHLTRVGGGFTTRLRLLNTSEDDQFFTLTGYRPDGSVASTVNVLVPASDIVSDDASVILGTDEASHVASVSNGEVVVSAEYRAISGQAAAAYVHESAQFETDVLVFLGERELVFDGMALVNAGSEPGSVEVDLLGEGGQVLESATLVTGLEPRAKTLAVFADLFTQSGFAVRVRSDQPFQAIYLRGTYVGADPAFLFANPGLGN